MNLDMHNIKRLALAACLSTLFINVGCTSSTDTTAADPATQGTANAEIQETDSIAGLPPQKEDSVPKGPQYTNHVFPTAEDALAFMEQSPDWSEYRQGILPQMAHEELAYATKLLNSPYKRFIVVDKSKMKVILFDKYGRVEKEYGMAGPRNYGTKHKKADSRTPEGYFSAEGIYDSTDWEFTDDDGIKHPGKCFGPRFVRVKNPVTTQVGIHGTSSPGSIGRRTSHGCIRLRDENILDLVKYVQIGMPIIILPSERDQAVNAQEGCRTGYFNTGVAPLPGANTGTLRKPEENKEKEKPEVEEAERQEKDTIPAEPEKQKEESPEEEPVETLVD